MNDVIGKGDASKQLYGASWSLASCDDLALGNMRREVGECPSVIGHTRDCANAETRQKRWWRRDIFRLERRAFLFSSLVPRHVPL